MFVRVGRSEDYRDGREPQLRIGDVIRLNSGSPRLLVVDLDGSGLITAAWRDAAYRVHELTLPGACFHRVSPLDR